MAQDPGFGIQVLGLGIQAQCLAPRWRFGSKEIFFRCGLWDASVLRELASLWNSTNSSGLVFRSPIASIANLKRGLIGAIVQPV